MRFRSYFSSDTIVENYLRVCYTVCFHVRQTTQFRERVKIIEEGTDTGGMVWPLANFRDLKNAGSQHVHRDAPVTEE